MVILDLDRENFLCSLGFWTMRCRVAKSRFVWILEIRLRSGRFNVAALPLYPAFCHWAMQGCTLTPYPTWYLTVNLSVATSEHWPYLIPRMVRSLELYIMNISFSIIPYNKQEVLSVTPQRHIRFLYERRSSR